MAVDMVTAIAKAVEAGATVWNTWLVSKDKRQMKAAIEAGEKYIFTNEDPNYTDKTRQKLLLKYRKRFFKYN